jgi:predicted amidohydrolase YtcJ
MVTRRSQTGADLDSSEAVSPAQALAAYTTLGAWAQREEHDKGSLEPGRLADLAVLDTDILSCDPAAIRATQVVATVVGGVIRHGG